MWVQQSPLADKRGLIRPSLQKYVLSFSAFKKGHTTPDQTLRADEQDKANAHARRGSLLKV